MIIPCGVPQGFHILSFWLVQNLSEGFPTSGNDNDNNTNIGFFDTLRSLPQSSLL
ncbi:MAG: hypothetical protein QMD44_06270 [Thermodesulfovibrionales bacterium]|nr:hypothetical protein [Thermodesulfovibrionales bacterium]